MYRIDIVKYSELGKVNDLESLLSNNQIDKPSLSKAFFSCLEAKDQTSDHLEIVRLLLQHSLDLSLKDPKNQSPIMLACCKGKLEVVKLLLAHGANPKETDRLQRTTIIMALNANHSDPIDLVKLLHEKEVNIHGLDFKSSTALHYAAYYGHRESLDYLIKQKVDPNIQDTDNNTALHLAFKMDKRACVDLLMNVTDKALRNSQGKTPLEEANGKSLANLSLWKYQKDESRRGRGSKTKSKPYTRRSEKEAGECFSCKRITEVFCRECSKFCVDKSQESSDKSSILKELEDCLKVSQNRIKELEKENGELKEFQGSKTGGYNVKSRPSPLYLKKMEEKKQEQIFQCMQGDINSFVRDQERFLANAQQNYLEAISIFKALIKETLPNVEVEVFGSFSTGMLLPYSDIDLVIIGCTTTPITVLRDLFPKINAATSVTKTEKIFTASIPVIKVTMEHKKKEIKIDITVQESKHKGVECTNLVKMFLGCFNTIKQVYLVIKQLMYFCNFHEPFRGGISSYGLFLMVVYFYQENMSNWKFAALDKESNYAMILTQFLEFYTFVFSYQKCIVVEFENWDNKELKARTVSCI